MDLLLLRHGIAEEPSQFRGEDSERPLTNQGRQEMQLEAQAMRRLLDDSLVIAASPFVRTRETAQIVNAEFPDATYLEIPELAMGGSVNRIMAEVYRFRDQSQLLLVGHEPELVEILTLVTGISPTAVQMKKGALTCLGMRGFEPRPRGVLRWHLGPSHLLALSQATSAM